MKLRYWVGLGEKVAAIAASAGVADDAVIEELARRAALSQPDEHLPDVLDGLALAVAEGRWPA